jgi:hypothetical protein
MRIFNFILALLFSASLAFAGEPVEKQVLSFSLTDANKYLSCQLVPKLMLHVKRDGNGWEVGVFKGSGRDNLLYPHHLWHGAFPSQISAGTYQAQIFPNERIIPIRGYKGSIRIRLIDAAVSVASGSARFTGGRVEIYYKNDVPFR